MTSCETSVCKIQLEGADLHTKSYLDTFFLFLI